MGSGKSPIYFKYGLFLLNEMIMFNRRLLGRPGKSGSATLANLYALFNECLVADNYSVGVDNSLNQFDDYTPSLQVSYREAKEQSCEDFVSSTSSVLGLARTAGLANNNNSHEAELHNQNIANDVNV